MTDKTVYNALTIADEILKIAKRKDIFLTPMQLTKLVYIAHGWSLAILDRDLFKDRIEAWKFGPVIPTLYRATKHFGRNQITAEYIDDDEDSAVDNEVVAFLDDVVGKYGRLSGFALSNLTHRSGTPWDQRYIDGVQNIEIEDDLIKAHYKSKLNVTQKTAGSAA